MAFGKILGVITEVMPAESGNKQNGGVWTRQQFVVKKIEESEYEHFVALTLSGEQIQKVAPQVGKVGWFLYDVESNKSNEGRWFTTAKCIRFDEVTMPAGAPQPQQANAAPAYHQPAPVQQGGYQQPAPAYGGGYAPPPSSGATCTQPTACVRTAKSVGGHITPNTTRHTRAGNAPPIMCRMYIAVVRNGWRTDANCDAGGNN